MARMAATSCGLPAGLPSARGPIRCRSRHGDRRGAAASSNRGVAPAQMGGRSSARFPATIGCRVSSVFGRGRHPWPHALATQCGLHRLESGRVDSLPIQDHHRAGRDTGQPMPRRQGQGQFLLRLSEPQGQSTPMFMPRAVGDRPLPVRAAPIAGYQLLSIDEPIPPVSHHDRLIEVKLNAPNQ